MSLWNVFVKLPEKRRDLPASFASFAAVVDLCYSEKSNKWVEVVILNNTRGREASQDILTMMNVLRCCSFVWL